MNLDQCERCSRFYDEDMQWKSCPHLSLDGPEAMAKVPLFCEQHDLFYCPLGHSENNG
jgi:hypothetical protein